MKKDKNKVKLQKKADWLIDSDSDDLSMLKDEGRVTIRL